MFGDWFDDDTSDEASCWWGKTQRNHFTTVTMHQTIKTQYKLVSMACTRNGKSNKSIGL